MGKSTALNLCMKHFFINRYFNKNSRIMTITVLVIGAHLAVAFIPFKELFKRTEKKEAVAFKVVDIEEVSPKDEQNNTVEISRQDKVAENMIETQKEIKEADADFLPQHMISEMPVIPINLLNSKQVYPVMAKKQGIEGVVYLELFIDQNGNIKKLKILKDSGFGFGEAAAKAFEGIKCVPARSNGIQVAARIRFPLRFSLK